MHRAVRIAAVPTLALALAAPAARAQTNPPAPAALPAAGSADQAALAARATALADEFIRKGIEFYPEAGTQFGIPGLPHDRLSDNSLAGIAREQAWEDDLYTRVAAIDADRLVGTQAWITYGFLREQMESSRQTRVCRNELWAVDQQNGWQVSAAQLAHIQPVGSDSLRGQAVARWRAWPRYIDNETDKLREGVRQGYTAPKIVVRRVIAQMDALLATPPAQSPLLDPATRDSTPAFRAEMTRIVADSVYPAAKRYRDYLADEYLPAAREAVAVSANPHGADCYQAQVRSYTTLNVAPREIHRIGLEQMAHIDAEMRQVAQQSFHTADVPALLRALKTDPQYTFHSRAEIVAYAQQAIDRAGREAPKWFGRLPKAAVIVEPYREFEEQSQSGGSYSQPAADGSRPGVYHINTYQPEKQSRAGLESTAFHETIPGHHLQLAIAGERTDAHIVTRILGNSGYSEGWGLYAERLADEMGLFSGPVDRMGLLSNEALRAARMVVDPGIHVLGWTRQQAIDYLLAHTAESPDAAATEIDRYIINPGQATSYMLGNLEIRRLREQAKQELGDRFDIRAFHDQVLDDGSVTLPMLRAKIQRWIAQQKQVAAQH